ncbi:tyrosine-type recombinase/integrase [Paraburkholderia sp. J76]|uniref:tyrosine-type recombinase/integrase n=1 Tax=Paraburkholderia sp. J76 TaxID=2805439 RepID=UPI002ABE4F10|nr:tyrosine-type recombinase/integrase [Paraburkholderia sp. J76]
MPTPLPPGVHLRPGSTVFQIRIGVPNGLENFYRDPKTGKQKENAYRASLRTSNRDEAITRALKLIAEYRERHDAMRAKSAPPPFVPLTPALAQQFVVALRHKILQADDNVTYLTPERDLRAMGMKGLKRAHTADLEALKRGDLQAAQAHAETTAEAWGFRVDWSSPTGKQCLLQIARASVTAWRDVSRRRQGEPIDTPVAPEPPVVYAEPVAPAESPKTLRDVVPNWVRHRAPAKAALDQTERSLRRFEEAVGVIPLEQITKATGAKFVAYLLDEERGFGYKTAADVAASISSLVKIAVRDDLMERNPMDLTIDKTIGAGDRIPWSDEELTRLFSHPLFTVRMGETPQWNNVTPEDGRAALLLLMHTGARLGEIAQLRRQDFQTHSGFRTIRITEDAGTVKTRESNRTIPLPGHLLADPWFAAWLGKQTGGDGPAFPSLVRPKARATDVLNKWFLEMRKACKLPMGRNNGSHRFRHWLRSALASKDVGDATADSITGHAAQGSSGRKVYTVTSLAAMREALDRLDWPKVAGE